MISRALVVGAGYVGGALVDELRQHGVETWSVRRSARPDDPRALAVDVGDAAALSRALAPLCDGPPLDLFYLVSAGGPREDAYRLAYVDGLRHVLAAGLPLRRLAFASSTAVYGQSDGSWVDEQSPCEPAGFSGRILLEGEALLQSAGAPAVAVRYGGIYGPTRTRLIDRILAGDGIAQRDAVQWRSRIHRDDCAGVMRHLASLSSIPRVVVAVDEEPSDQREVERWLCRQLGRDPATLTPPGPPQRHGGNKRCSSAWLCQSGYRLRFPSYREGYGALIGGVGSSAE